MISRNGSSEQKPLSREMMSAGKTQWMELIGSLLHFLFGILLSIIRIGGASGPFGIAATAQWGWGTGGVLCGLGAGIGYLSAFGAEQGMAGAAAIVLVLCANYAVRGTETGKKIFYSPILASAVCLITETMEWYAGGADGSPFLRLLLQALLAFGAAYFFREAFSRAERMTETAELRHSISVLLLLACGTMALSRLQMAGIISVGRIFGMLLVLIFANRGGAVSGALAGVALGIAMDAVSGAGAFFSAAYALSGLVSGTFFRNGRLLFLLAFLLSNTLAFLCAAATELHPELILEALAAIAVFPLLPGKIVVWVGALLKRPGSMSGEAGLRRYTAARIRQMGLAFGDLYDTVDAQLHPSGQEEDIGKIFDRASEQICSRCKSKNICWNAGYVDTLAAFNDAGNWIQTRGCLQSEDFPSHFLEHCENIEGLVAAVNGELRGAMYRKQFSARLAENRRAAYGQYADVSRILMDVSEELDSSCGPDPLAQRRLGHYLESLDVEGEVTAFRDRTGRLHILIESGKLRKMLPEPGTLDRLSDAVGVRLCRPIAADEQTEGRITLMEAEPLSASVGVASMRKNGETVSGDRGTYFKTDRGLLCILLSDGMGTGENAARESVAAVRILERFLRTGVDPVQAMKILNSLMLLKNENTWGFATVDLLCVDLFSGEASFYKYGAAPSYVKAGKQVRRVHSDTFAAGLSATAEPLPGTVKMRLHPGNIAVIASDGVLAESDDTWIKKLLSDSEPEDMKALARSVLQTALKQYGAGDDMTVLTVRIGKRT